MTVRIVNAYPGSREDSYRLVLVKEDGSRELVEQTYDYFRSDGTRVQCRNWKDRQQRIESGIDGRVLEGDLSLVRRYLADHPEVEIARPRWCWIDLETDPTPGFERKQDMRILVASAVGEDGARHTEVLEDWSDAAEAKLITGLFGFIKNYQAILSWNLGSSWGDSGFDGPVLRGRCDHIWEGSSRRLNKYIWLDHLHAFKRLHLMFAETGEERASYSLDAVSKFVLGEKKYEFDARRSLEEWQAGGTRRARLVEYCEDDVGKLPRIEAKTGILALSYEVARLCGCLNDTSGLHPTTFVDSYLLRLAGQRGLRLPTKPPYQPKGGRKKIPGAIVFEPSGTGIQKDIISFDYSSLYPSIFRMLNASFETGGGDGAVSPMTGQTFAASPEGIIPAMFGELGKMKKEAKDDYKRHPKGSPAYVSALQHHDAIKSVVNSGYGYVISDDGRIRDKKLGESVTQTGKYLITKIAEQVEERGWRVAQGDTDSLYVHGATVEQAQAFLTWCNDTYLPSIARAHRCPGKPPVLEFDSRYERMVITSKKKYCGRYADSDEIVIRGLECRRGDASPLARKLQEQVIDKLLKERSEDPEDFPVLIIAMREHILHGELPSEEIILSESIRKDLADYEVTNPAVSAARIMQARGEDVSNGTRIKYVVVDGSVSPVRVIPASDYTGQADRYYYWENLVFPPTERLLGAAFPDADWTVYSKVRPGKVRDCAEKKYQAALERRGQMRIPGT